MANEQIFYCKEFEDSKPTLEAFDFDNDDGTWNYSVWIGTDIYKLSLDTATECCESLNHWGQDLDDMRKWYIKSVSSIKVVIESEMFGYMERHTCKLIIMLDDGNSVSGCFSNFHNGYYPHFVHLQLFEDRDIIPVNLLTTTI